MTTETDLKKPFVEFAERNGDYYAAVFLQIQKSTLGRFHINKAALLGSFVWAALRGNWALFVIGFAVDLIAAVNLCLVYKYSKAAADNADKAFLVERYEGWSQTHLIAAIIAFVVGRFVFAWLADRFYAAQYSKWRIDRSVNTGVSTSRVVLCALIAVLIVPLMLFTSSRHSAAVRSSGTACRRPSPSSAGRISVASRLEHQRAPSRAEAGRAAASSRRSTGTVRRMGGLPPGRRGPDPGNLLPPPSAGQPGSLSSPGAARRPLAARRGSPAPGKRPCRRRRS